jgi:hypothetical protein
MSAPPAILERGVGGHADVATTGDSYEGGWEKSPPVTLESVDIAY